MKKIRIIFTSLVLVFCCLGATAQISATQMITDRQKPVYNCSIYTLELPFDMTIRNNPATNLRLEAGRPPCNFAAGLQDKEFTAFFDNTTKKLTTPNNSLIKLADLFKHNKDKVMLLDFWFSWRMLSEFK